MCDTISIQVCRRGGDSMDTLEKTEQMTTMTVSSEEKRAQFYITMPDEMQRVLSNAMMCYSEMKLEMEQDIHRDMAEEMCFKYQQLDLIYRGAEAILSDFIMARHKAGMVEEEIQESSVGIRSKMDGISLVLERAGMALESTYGIKAGSLEKLPL